MEDTKAFPGHKNPEHSQFPFALNEGMTLRDYFAGKVLMSISNDWQNTPSGMAERAYSIADAMLKARIS